MALTAEARERIKQERDRRIREHWSRGGVGPVPLTRETTALVLAILQEHRDWLSPREVWERAGVGQNRVRDALLRAWERREIERSKRPSGPGGRGREFVYRALPR